MRPIDAAELNQALTKTRTFTSSGCDGVPAVFLKMPRHPPPPDVQGPGPRVLVPPLTRLFNMIKETGCTPEWRISYITPLHKRGDLGDMNNYRAIAVTCVQYRLYAKILNKRLVAYLEARDGLLPDVQFGFRPRRSAVQAAWVLRTVCDARAADPRRRKVYCAMLDLTQAYDRVQHHLLLSLIHI